MVENSSVPNGPDAYRSYIGATLGEYRLDQVLEESEVGPIFLARTSQASFRVQLLTVPPDLASQDRMVWLGRFQREANLVASLRHPGLLPLLDYGIYQSFPYLVMPRLKMTSLSAYLSKQGALDTLLASRYLDQIADALEYAHAQAALHLSLSTDCIFVKEDNSLVVANLGIVRMVETGGTTASLAAQEQERNHFILRDRQGRALYGLGPGSSPAPEQLLVNPVDTYTDVYALGAVLYRMLTGHRVFRGTNAAELAQQHLTAPVPPLSKWRAGIAPQVDALIAKAMSKEPSQRFRQPGLVANAYHDSVAPNDTQRRAFAVGAPSLVSTQASRDAAMAAAPLAPKQVGPRPSSARPSGTPRGTAGRANNAGISRRRLLVGGGAAVAIVAVTVFASHYLIGTTTPGGTTTTNGGGPGSTGGSGGHAGTVIAHTSDVQVNSAKTFPIANQQNPGVLVHLQNNSFVAFDSTCTHAGCAVAYNPQDHLLECPCHGASFDPAKGASVVQGPATTPLTSIPIKVNADNTITT
ncbi:MAG TPA: protein kinase [Ktedonobacteraceae bacterium]|nr:protein kinase [Ktedonobacteraceae bacterium]